MHYDDIIRSRKENIIIIAGVALAFLLFPLLSFLLLPKMAIAVNRLVYSRLLIWLSVGILFVYARYAERQKFFLWKEQHYTFGFYILSIVALFGCEFVAGILSAIPHLAGWVHENFAYIKKVNAVANSNKVLMYFTIITAGVTEELLMRGYILPRLALFFRNEYWPIIISAAMFSALHLGYHSLAEIIFTFLFGVICATYYHKYRNINVLIIFHFLVDFFALHHR